MNPNKIYCISEISTFHYTYITARTIMNYLKYSCSSASFALEGRALGFSFVNELINLSNASLQRAFKHQVDSSFPIIR